MSDVPETLPDRDWKAEARGLGYMILAIAERYSQAKHVGGDSELLESSIRQAGHYVNGPLREALESDSSWLMFPKHS